MFKDRLFNDNWQFFLCGSDELSIENVDGESFTDIEIPHDWLIGDTRNLYKSGDGWYRKSFNATAEMLNGKVFISFDAVYMDSTLYINHKKAGDWKYGYSSFSFDITDYLSVGENLVHVVVRHKSPNTRWYSGAGIYRNVYLRIRNKEYIEENGVYISPRLEGDEWKVYIDTEAVGGSRIAHSILDENGSEIGAAVGKSCVIKVKDPKLWDIYKGSLYTLRTALYNGETVVDRQMNTFGFRTVSLDPQKGFIINGRHEKMHGVCMHHDLGALGSAMNEAALKRQLDILVSYGVNAIRSSHNMPSRELVKLCNEMGLLLDDESFDMWEGSKTEFDYARFFPEWYKADVESWVKRDRNNPCVIMWSIGNEILDTHASLRGLEVARMLKEEVLKHDPRENAVCTIASNYMAWENAQKVSDYLKQGGYNYGERLYEQHHKEHPDWFIYGSETSSAVRSRGIYHLPASVDILTHEDLQCSDMANSCVGWGSPMEKAWIMDRDNDYCGGQFVWTGFDYIGEPTPYSTKNSYFGIVDTAGLKKESYYFYRSVWTDGSTNPFVHILPAWDFNEGQEIEVKTYSNLEDIELFFNGKSLGKQHIDLKNGNVLHGSWKINYAKGELIARAYDSEGREAATDRLSSFGEAASLKAAADKTILNADGADLAFITVEALDEKGEPVANARNRVKVKVEGAGRLLGLDSGDSTDYDSYKGDNKRLFSGKLVAIIGTTHESGEIKVTLLSKGLPDKTITLTAIPCDIPEGASAPRDFFPVYIQPENDTICSRKIELTADRTHLTKDVKKADVTAKILPENSDFKEIKFKCLMENGVESPIAEVEAEGNAAVVTAKGDGKFILRAVCNNGFDHAEIISDLYFTAEGLGDTLTDGYKFVSASYASFSNVSLNFVDKGAVSNINGRTVIGFDNVKTDDFGSKRLTLYIGCSNGKGIDAEIWNGDPEKSKSRLIDTVKIPDNGGWDRYMPVKLELGERVRGINSLAFVISQNCIFGGFEFEREDRARARLYASEYDEIYGDDYTVKGGVIEKIGNNVVIGFNNLDFGEEGVSRLTISGKTRNPENAVQIRYTPKGEGQITQAVNFAYSDDYSQQSFDIDKISGQTENLSFVFMPGSDFDFEWFRFE